MFPSSSSTCQIKLAFYVLDRWDKDEAFTTNLSRYLTGSDVVHVDLVFPDGVATSIYAGENVYLEPRNFRNTKKHLVAVDLPTASVRQMRAFADSCFKTGVQFNRSGFYRCALPSPLHRRTCDRKYFCSEYVTRILQQAGLFVDRNPGSVTPGMLMDWAVHSGSMSVTPARLQTAAANAVTSFLAKSATFPKSHHQYQPLQ